MTLSNKRTGVKGQNWYVTETDIEHTTLIRWQPLPSKVKLTYFNIYKTKQNFEEQFRIGTLLSLEYTWK